MVRVPLKTYVIDFVSEKDIDQSNSRFHKLKAYDDESAIAQASLWITENKTWLAASSDTMTLYEYTEVAAEVDIYRCVKIFIVMDCDDTSICI